MPPRPYSDRSVLPRDSSNSSVSVESDTVQMTTDASPGSLSSATTPSPIQQEVPVDMTNASETEEDAEFDVMHSPSAIYPTPADSMPFDHAFPDFIRQLTNERDLSNVHSLRLRVISRLVSLQRVSLFTMNLRELDLEGSILGSLRDIGCNLKFLQVLKVGNCKLDSLDGTFGLTSLRRLYAQRNQITDVSPCSNLPHIQHIDVSHNRIRNINYAGFLSVCRKLKSITFAGNPATHLPDYRDRVRRMLPHLQSLDDVTFGNEDVQHEEIHELIDVGEEFEKDFNTSESERDERFKVTTGKNDSVTPPFDTCEDHDLEIQEILKCGYRASRDRETNLLGLRKERGDGRELWGTLHDRGVNINYEETEDIPQNLSTSVSVPRNINDGLTLPPLKIGESELKKTSNKESFLIEQKGDKENLKLRIEERSTTSSVNLQVEANSSDFETLQGAQPKTVLRPQRPSTADGMYLSNCDGANSLDSERDCLRKRPYTAGMESTLHEFGNGEERGQKDTPQRSLTSGLLMCGNLAVALRNRKKQQQNRDTSNAKNCN